MSPVLMVLVAPLAIVTVLACLREPMRVALPVFAALIPFGGSLALGASRYSSLSSLAGLLLALSLALQVVSTRPAARRIPPDLPLWILFLGLAVATSLWSAEPDATRTGVMVLVSLVTVYALASLSSIDRTALRRTENAMMLGSVAAVLYGLVQLFFLGGFPDGTPGEGPSPTGRFGNDLLGPNLQAVALILPLALALNRAVGREETRGRRVMYALVAGLMVLGTLMTASRGGLVATGVAVVVLALAGRPEARGRLLGFSAVGAAAAAAVWLYHPMGLATRTFESVTSSSGRTEIWEVGAAACRTYCSFGSGWGTFPSVYAETQASVPGARVLVGEGAYQPHSVWLLAVIELGILGLILMVAAFLLTIREASKLSATRRGPAMSALAGLLMGLFFLSGMEFKFFWMVLIFVAVSRNLELAEAEESAAAPEQPANAAEVARPS